MNNLRKLLFFALFLFYAAGIFTGAERELHTPDQAEIYQYLSDGVKFYDTAPISGVKAAATENLKAFTLIAAGGLIKALVWLSGAALILMGYLTGFSVMAALRLYGINGMLLCVPNLVSAAFIIPAAAFYGSTNAAEMILGDKKNVYRKKIPVLTIFLFAIFCADALLKGTLSPIFVKWAASLLATE